MILMNINDWFGATSRVIALALVLSAPAFFVAGCAGSQQPGDRAARDIEKILAEYDEALAADDYDEAVDLLRDINRTVERDRKEIEMHPEASMIFTRVDNAERKLRQLEKRIAEKRAQDEALAVEDTARKPLEEAAQVAQEALDGWPTQADVAKLKGKIGAAQDALNDARRSGKIEAEGEFVTEIEARLEALRSTLKIAERKAIAGDARTALEEGLHAIELATERKTPSEKLGDYDSARNKLTACKEIADKLIGEDPEAAALELEVKGEGKALTLKQLTKRCAKEERGLNKKLAAANREQKAIDKLKKFADKRSADQRRVLEEFGKKPDVMRKKKGKEIWTFVERKKVKKGKRTKTQKTYHEYTFDREGKLLDQKSKKR
jgi:hypothetical protein